MKYAGSDWLKKQGAILSELGTKVGDILGETYQGIYHLPYTTLFHKRTIWHNKSYIEIVIRGEISTFDFNRLTDLVVLSHDKCVRLSISGASNNYLRLIFSTRTRKGRTMERHPTIEEHIKLIRGDL